MKVKVKPTKIDLELRTFIEDIKKEKERRGQIVSMRRVSKAIPRVPGLKEALLNAKWEEE